MCIWDLQCFQGFRNGCLFYTYWLIWNLNCADSHHASYGKRCSNNHFQHCAQCVYEIYSGFKVFEIALCFAHFGLFEFSTPVMSNILTMANIVLMIITNVALTVHMTFTVLSNFSKWLFVLHILAYSKFELRSFSPWWTLFKSSFKTLRTVCIWDLQCFQGFRNCCLFCTFFFLRNFYSSDAPHGNYGKHCLTHHFQHCAHCVYEIYSIFKVFEIAVCFAHFVVFEIWTPLILTMLAMVSLVQIIISNIAHSVYMRFTVFSKFSKLLFVLHILAYSKFLLR